MDSGLGIISYQLIHFSDIVLSDYLQFDARIGLPAIL